MLTLHVPFRKPAAQRREPHLRTLSYNIGVANPTTIREENEVNGMIRKSLVAAALGSMFAMPAAYADKPSSPVNVTNTPLAVTAATPFPVAVTNQPSNVNVTVTNSSVPVTVKNTSASPVPVSISV